MGVSYYQPLAEDKVSIVRCEREEVGGKVLTQGIRTILGRGLSDEIAKQIEVQ